MESKTTLNNGIEIPHIGLGTWQIDDGDDVYRAVSKALETGYRLIDTAAIYGNETGVGQAVIESPVSREEIFVTTKLWNSDQGRNSVEAAFQASLDRLGLNYIDLYLIHWPMPETDKFVETWQVFEQLIADGKVRAIGVSNFKPDHLQKLLAETDVVPAVNQIELHPRMQQIETRDFCSDHDIQVQAYSPLMRAGEILENPTLKRIAENHDKSAAQIIIRWHIQNGLIPIPKSAHPERIAENFDVFDFELSEQEMSSINELDDQTRINADPDEFNQ